MDVPTIKFVSVFRNIKQITRYYSVFDQNCENPKQLVLSRPVSSIYGVLQRIYCIINLFLKVEML